MIAGFRRRFRPYFVIWLTFMWMMLMGEFNWANFIGGLVAALAVVLLLPLPAMPIAGLHIKWGKLIVLLVSWLWDLMLASVQVAWLALRPQDPPKTSIVKMPMRVQNDLVLSFAIVLFNLQPGGAVTDIDIANRMLTIHLLHAGNEEELQRELDTIKALERRLIDIFERG